MKEIKYDAFISYRHAPLDSLAAKNLHRQLENFRVPRLADRELQKKAKKRINSIFRDRDELPVSSNLAESIQLALEAAEYLIVICSPRTPESLWVRKEIETFIQLHGPEHVLAVLIEGEPQESFPPELRKVKIQTVDAQGNTQIREQDIEPLAADIRGNSPGQMQRLLKKEVLRLAAPILDCSYDDLKQRHKEQKLKKMISVFAVAAGILLAFGGFSTFQALRISRQAVIITQKAEELQIENENNKILQSKSLAKQALELYTAGDRIRGILLAQSALPENIQEPERPYVAQAQEALTQTLQVYETGTTYKPYCLLTQDANIKMVRMSPKGQTAATQDEAGTLALWNMQDGQQIFSQPISGTVTADTAFCYLDEETFLYGGSEGIYAVDTTSGQIKWSQEDVYVSEVAVCKEKPIIAFSDGYVVQVYNLAEEECLFTYEGEGDFALWNGLSLSPNGRFLSIGLYAGPDNGPAGIMQIDLEKQEIVGNTTLAYDWITQAQITDDGTCYVCNKDTVTSGSFLAAGPEKLYSISGQTGENWQYDTENTMHHNLSIQENQLFCITESNLEVISSQTGECLQQIGYSNSIVGYQPEENSHSLYVFLQDGTIQGTNLEDSANPGTYLQTGNGYAAYMAVCEDNVLVQPGNSNSVEFYKAKAGAKAKEYEKLEGYVMQSLLSTDDEKLAAATFSASGESRIYAFSTSSQEMLWSQKLADTTGIQGMLNSADGSHVLVITYSSIYIYEWQTGELTNDWNKEDIISFYTDEEGKTLYLFLFSGCEIYDLNTFMQTGSFSCYNMVSGGHVRAGRQELLYIDYDGTGVALDLTKDDSFEALPWQATLLDYCSQNDTYIIANPETDEIQLYQAEKNKLLQSMEKHVTSVEQLQFSPEGDKFYIQDLNHSIAVYDTESFTLLKRITNLTGKAGEWISSQEGRLQLLMDDEMYHAAGYLLNEDLDVIATVPALWNMSSDGTQLFTIQSNGICQFPVYNQEALMEEAKEQLQGRILTTEEKEQYFVE